MVNAMGVGDGAVNRFPHKTVFVAQLLATPPYSVAIGIHMSRARRGADKFLWIAMTPPPTPMKLAIAASIMGAVTFR